MSEERKRKSDSVITRKSEREINLMDEVGTLHAQIHEKLRDKMKVGVTGNEIDQFVQNEIESQGAKCEQIGYQGYQYATCISVNDEICHGFPSDYAFQEGDLVKVDFVINKDGALSDSCWSYGIGQVAEETRRLMEVTQEALYRGIEQAQAGNRVGDIGHAIQSYAEGEGFSVVREFVGHGLGPTLHEGPTIYHYGEAGKGKRLKEGMTITIEPMINTGTWKSTMDDNGWTARTADGGLSCQYEHTLAITSDGPRILTEQKDERSS